MGPVKNFCFAKTDDVWAWHLTDTNTERFAIAGCVGLKQCFLSGGPRVVHEWFRIWVGSEPKNIKFTSLRLFVFIISVSLLLQIGRLLSKEFKVLRFFVAAQSSGIARHVTGWLMPEISWQLADFVFKVHEVHVCWTFLQMKISPSRCLETSGTSHPETRSYIAE
jgi:hypothetical protein